MKKQFSRINGVLVVTHGNGVSTFRTGNRQYTVKKGKIPIPNVNPPRNKK